MNIGHLTSLKCWVMVACAAMVFAHGAVLAEDDSKVEFDIAAQELGEALTEFGIQSGREVYFVSNDVADVQTRGIEGAYTATDAIHQLLNESGVEYFVDDNGTLLVGTAYAAEESVDGESNPGKSQPASSQVLMAQNQTSASQQQNSQTSQTTDNDDEQAVQKLENIIVTGSRIRGPQNASPIITITRQEIEQAGFSTVAELVEKLPQNFGAGASADTFADSPNNTNNVVGGQVDGRGGTASVNLRGLGVGSTLVLLNGRRLSPSGRSAGFANISSIPVTAIERVEILTDGASAIYGSDAIAGVVNFILRDDYEGAETRLRYGVAEGGVRPEVLFGQSLGKSWDDGSVLLTYEYYDRDSLASRDRDITSSSDLRRFGGTDHRTPGGNPANILAGGQLFAIPVGQDGSSLTAGDFDSSAPLNLYNDRKFRDVMPTLERHSAFLSLKQTIGSLEFFGTAHFSTQETQTRSSSLPVDLTVTDSNPFFVDPTGAGLTTVIIDNYSLNEDLGSTDVFGGSDSLGVGLGVRFNMGGGWNGELVGNWSLEESIGRFGSLVDLVALNAALTPMNPGDPVFNPFGDGSNTDSAVLETIMGLQGAETAPSENDLWQVNFNIDGSVFDIAGGAVNVAAGAEFREESLLVEGDVLAAINVSRDVVAVYAETFFPLVGNSNSRPGLQRLELSVAARYEDYGDFGDTVNPKAGLVWSPTQSLTLRGTWGTSFKAPGMLNLNASVGNVFYLPQIPFVVPLGFIPFPIIAVSGGNKDLKPEEATSWTAGIQWNPEWVRGLSLDITYFNIDFENRIGLPTNSIIEGSNDPRFASVFNTNPTAEQIAVLVNDPNWNELFGVPAADVLSGAAPVGGILDLRTTNLARSVVTGVELQLSHGFEIGGGSIITSLNASYMLDFKRQLIEADPLVDEVDTLGRPVDFRARGNMSWARDGWTVSGFVNYIDGYTDNSNNTSAREVGSWTTADLTITYNTGEKSGFLGGTRFSLTTRNIFDVEPPFVDTIAGLAYDTVNGDPLGRILSLQVTKEW